MTETVEAVAPVAHTLAVDLGTGGPKVALVSTDGDVIGHEYERNDLILLPDGGVEQDPDQWWSTIVTATHRLLARGLVPVDDIVAVSITTQWMTTVAVGADGRHIGNAISWMDTRGARYAQQAAGGGVVVPTVGYNARKLRQWLRVTGGVPSRTGKDPVGQMLFLKHERPEVYAAATSFLEPMDYLNLRLTGRAVASYDTIVGHWVTDNRDLDHVSYDDELIDWIGVDRAKLPELVPTGSIIGTLTEAAAAELGLGRHVQVVAGTGDTASAGIGSGAVRDFEGHLYIGTSSWMSCHVPFKKTDILSNITVAAVGHPRPLLGRHRAGHRRQVPVVARRGPPLPRRRHGTATRPTTSTTGSTRWPPRAAPGSGKVIFLPWLNGERTPVDNHLLRGGWFNASMATDPGRPRPVRVRGRGPQHPVDAGGGREVHQAARSSTSTSSAAAPARRCGARSWPTSSTGRSARWPTPCWPTSGAPASRPRSRSGTCAGTTSRRASTITETFQPNPRNRDTYDRLFAAFVDLYKKNKGIYARLNRHSK